MGIPRLVGCLVCAAALSGSAQQPRPMPLLPAPITLSSGWLMQDIAQVKVGGSVVSTLAFAPPIYTPTRYVPPPTANANPATNPGANGAVRPPDSSAWTQAPGLSAPNWYRATVPGTVLTTLIDNKVYPDPLYGENNRPNIIPESLCRTSYWFRTSFVVPATYAHRHSWLTFEEINYLAEVWVNGTRVGEIDEGAFARGIFDVTSLVTPGSRAAVAVLIKPPTTPLDPLEQTQQWGLGLNGGAMSKDGPTFVSTQGWDWIPAIRDRDIGIWQKVTLSASGPVRIADPYVTTDVTIPGLERADVTIAVTVRNVTASPQTGVIRGTLGAIAFASAPIAIEANASRTVTLTPTTTPQLRVAHPQLWWPNGYGAPHLYPLRLAFDIDGSTSDVVGFNVGIRRVDYHMDGSDNLTLVVNGVPVFAKGGDWGMDDALKRLPTERLDAMMRLHRDANYTLVRNWVGQSTSEDFYALADRYGLMVWDEFFQPGAGYDSGRERGETGETDIFDVPRYLANAREKVLRFRNHPSIVIWCGRNEGDPSPMALLDGLKRIMAESDPARAFQANSDAGRGVRSGGPYAWQAPAAYYGEGRGGRGALTPFKTEIGAVSIPTIEAIYAMMPAADAEHFPNDDWAEHDFATGGGNNSSANYLTSIAARYGDVSTLPRFVRAAQMMDYEAFRALYEGRMAKLFHPSTAVITWMSNPAQPSLTWQIYSYDLEPFASFFGTRKANESLHIQMNQSDGNVMVVNHLPRPQTQLTYRLRVIDADGATREDITVGIPEVSGSTAADIGMVDAPAGLSAAHFVKLELFDAKHRLVSDNFYWRNSVAPNDFTALGALPTVSLGATIDGSTVTTGGQRVVRITLTNATTHVALMAHVQLRNARTSVRVLPVSYSDNYISLVPGERRTIIITAASKDFGGDAPLVTVDGWNVTTLARSFAGGARVAPNPTALVTPDRRP